MMLRTAGLAVGVLSVALTSCGGGDGRAAQATVTVTPAVTETVTSAPVVSEKTTCDLLFGGGGTSPFQPILGFIKRPSNTPAQAARVRRSRDSLMEIAASADSHLKPQIEAYANQIGVFLSNASTGATTDSTALKAAGLELTNTCGPLGS